MNIFIRSDKNVLLDFLIEAGLIRNEMKRDKCNSIIKKVEREFLWDVFVRTVQQLPFVALKIL